MAIRVVRLGTTRHPKEGLRIGTVRRPPRGVRKTQYARRNYFDVWLPELAPARRWYPGRFQSRSHRSAGPSSHGATGAKCLNRHLGVLLPCWLRCRRGRTFRWVVTAKTKADAIDLC